MSHYYFIEIKGKKEGPFSFEDLKKQNLNPNQLIWRSDNTEWKKAIELNELSDYIINIPPPLPNEVVYSKFENKFKSHTIRTISIVCMIICILLTFFSFNKADSDWKKYLNDTKGAYLIENINTQNNDKVGRGPLISKEEYERIANDPNSTVIDRLKAASDASDFRENKDDFITNKELDDNKRYPIYNKGFDNESNYASKQSFLFRPLNVFSSTIYLYKDEQKSSPQLLMNLFLSSFLLTLILFVTLILLIFYIKKLQLTTNLV